MKKFSDLTEREVLTVAIASEEEDGRLRFTVDHVVRRGTIAWFGRDALAIHTDYGCASLYAVP
jgi:hypothetical protein